MKSLQEIKAFPKAQRDVLRKQFGISSAEAFFEHATRSAEGVRTALGLSSEQLAALRDAVEGYLAPEFVKACRKPLKKHARGVIVD